MKNTTIALFLLALVGNVFAADCATTEKAKTEAEIKKEMEEKEVPAVDAK
jgi:hypothetical protein